MSFIAPKLMARAVGIEYERLRFREISPALKTNKGRDAVKRHLVTFFLGKKVTMPEIIS